VASVYILQACAYNDSHKGVTYGEMNFVSEHTLAAITAWATAIAALAAAVAVWASWQGIKKQAEQTEKSRQDFKLSLGADLSMKLDDRFSSHEFQQARSRAAQALLSGQKLVEAEEVFDFFETVGLLVRTGAVSKELAYNFFFHWINLYWIAGQSHIQEKRKVARSVWEDFEYLYKLLREVEEAKDRNSADLKFAEQHQRLKELLSEEIIEEE